MKDSWRKFILVTLCVVTLSVCLTGCFIPIVVISSIPYTTVRESFDYRAPLDSNASVTIIYAREVPVLPENLELVATMGGVNEEACIAAYEDDFWNDENIRAWARELGASVAYVKVAGRDAPCMERTVEFLVEKDGGKNEKN